VYKKLYKKNALKLIFASGVLVFIGFFAQLFFSRARSSSQALVFTNRILNKKICECQILHEKCEYFKRELENENKKYASV